MPRILENDGKIKRKFLHKGFQGHWLQIRCQIYQIQDSGSNMADILSKKKKQ